MRGMTRPVGRPKKLIDQKQFEGLCGLQCTTEEICSFFDITDKTLQTWCKETYGVNFSVVFQQKRNKGKISLRRSQFKLAERNANMAIFLGKQMLGQKDRQEIEMSGGVELSIEERRQIVRDELAGVGKNDRTPTKSS